MERLDALSRGISLGGGQRGMLVLDPWKEMLGQIPVTLRVSHPFS